MRLKDGEVIDDLQREGLKIIQHSDKFKFGIDAVLLSGFVKAKRTDSIIDLGTGTGIIPILLSAKTDSTSIIGVEIQEDLADMALRSVEMNGLGNRIEICKMDIQETPDKLGHSIAEVVVSNPPYFKKNSAIENPRSEKAIARHEVLITIESLISAAVELLKPGGNFYMIHRPDRLVDVISTMRANRLEPKEIRFVRSNCNNAPNLFLVRGNKGGRPGLRFLDPLDVYDLSGAYSREIYDIYNATAIDVFDKRGK